MKNLLNNYNPNSYFNINIVKNFDKSMYAMIQHQVINPCDPTKIVYIFYLLNLNNAIITQFKYSEQPFKSNKVLELLLNLNDEGFFKYENTIILTLNVTPFSTQTVRNGVNKINAKLLYYRKSDILPIVDFSKDYMTAVTRITILNHDENFNLDHLKDMADNWNKIHQPVFEKMGKNYNYDPNILYFK
jgi:hypothetical protein